MDGEEAGDWVAAKTLGSGGFGVVVLWKNKRTKEALALKKCRWANDSMITPKHRQRWDLEVQIMKKLEHENVVKALEVPPELDVPPSEMPVLAMEYCCKGDLRKALNAPENCCGLREAAVRKLTRDVSAAIEYLHSRRIIHRDLKPENIVLQDLDGRTTIYKLIDLGYAKDMDQNSVCTSFVGTLQYLAPELFLSQNYSSTVDYWSFGLVTHECIVGFRPFLPTSTPAQWMVEVCRKRRTDICVYRTSDGAVHFSEGLFRENNLTEPFTKSMEKWLQVMLEYNPQERGVMRMDDGQKCVVAFSLLKEILSEKIIKVFYVPMGKVYEYKVDETVSMADLRDLMAKHVGIEAENLELLLPRGHPPDFEKSAVQCWAPLEEDDVEWLLFAFSKHNTGPDIKCISMPLIDQMLRDRKVEVSYEEQRKMWSHGVLYIHRIVCMYQRLLHAYRVLLMHLLIRNSQVNKLKTKMTDEMQKLSAKVEFLQCSMNCDKQSYDSVVDFTSRRLESTFQCPEFLKKVDELRQRVGVADTDAQSLNAKTVELQRSPFSRPKRICELQECYKRAVEAYGVLKMKPKEERKNSNNGIMVSILSDCLKAKTILLKKYFSDFERVTICKSEIASFTNPLEGCVTDIQKLNSELVTLQQKRQRLIWEAVNQLVHKVANLQSSSTTKPVTTNGPLSTESQGSFMSSSVVSGNPSLSSSSTSPLSMSAILSRSSEDSMSAIQTNQELRQRMQEQLQSLNQSLFDSA